MRGADAILLRISTNMNRFPVAARRVRRQLWEYTVTIVSLEQRFLIFSICNDEISAVDAAQVPGAITLWHNDCQVFGFRNAIWFALFPVHASYAKLPATGVASSVVVLTFSEKSTSGFLFSNLSYEVFLPSSAWVDF